ncbi:MAG: DEAD/DEAH box helicase [Desulfobacteraceae bacterium]|uniref:DEAD/DEAH box helicase n=1 Tax=Candidatus Desulfacyla euxinica TaxID=2841693 RepID=A0A8J6T748_9DELT|nr:DEAD/DEAH box helicase [Candidatus Desulfacyla euxinica]MBL6977992.1 DEAD/DEAH box helicase [Desulfobacteraceae bacterium]
MIIHLKNNLTLTDIPRHLKTELMTRLSFQNPKFLEAKRMNRWVGKIPRYLHYYTEADDGLVIPRGFIRELLELCKERNVHYFIEDHRRVLPAVDFTFKGNLRPFQERAVADILEHDSGTVSSPTGSGKTVMALHVIAERRQPALVIVHTKELLYQWVDRIHSFLRILKEDVGIIGDGQKRVGDNITVALVQTLYKCADEVSPHIGFLIIDEAHRAPAIQFSSAVSSFDAKYTLALSATPFRRDKLTRLIYWFCGDLVHRVDPQTLTENGDILKVDAVIRETNFETFLNPSSEYSKVLSELTRDNERNHLITSDVVKETRNGGGICLVLSDRKQHCEDLQLLLRSRGLRPALLTGNVSDKDRQAIVEQLNQGKTKVLIATGQLIGEGFDCKGLSTLFLATPIRFEGRVIQYLGRVLRPGPGKTKAKVYDYADSKVGPLRVSAEARQRVYKGGF